MVSISPANIYALREHLLDKAIDKAGADPLKIALLVSLNVLPETSFTYDEQSISLYQKCAISGLGMNLVQASSEEFSRLLGQAATIDGTPRPWVGDIWGVLGVKYAIDAICADDLTKKFSRWIAGFLPERIKSGRLDGYELDLALYINGEEVQVFSSACMALYLHYQNKVPIAAQETKQKYMNHFFDDFKDQYDTDLPSVALALYVHVFDNINQDVSLVPPNNWELEDLLNFLENIPAGLKRWTWEDKARTKGGIPRKWNIDSEYHVQNLLYVMLAPMFEGLSDEENLESVGQKNPRVDLYLPSVHTIIEVKYRKDNKKSFSTLIGEIGEDISLYRSDPKYKNCQLICFLWDHTRSTQEHAKFKEGVLKMECIQGCVVVCSPSVME
jgi:hypothetical protein